MLVAMRATSAEMQMMEVCERLAALVRRHHNTHSIISGDID